MTKLSPAAQTVFDAINKELDEAPWDLTFIAGSAAAAALRAAADHIDHDWSAFNCIDALCEIAAELDGPSYTSKSQEQRKRFLDFIEKATP